MDKRLNLPTDIAQFTLHWLTKTGDDVCNVLYMRWEHGAAGVFVPQPWTDSVCNTQATNIVNGFVANWFPVLSNSVAIARCDWVRNDSVGAGPLHEGSVAGSGATAGAVLSDPLPTGVTLAIEFRTGLGGRGNHGRMFLPGIPLSYQDHAVDPDALTIAAQTAIDTACGGHLGHINNNNLIAGAGDNWFQVVTSFVQHGANRVPAVHHDITQVRRSDAFLDFQRRRQMGHSRHH